MPACKCGTQMKLEKEKVDNYYRYYWVCPGCGCKVDSPYRLPVVKDKK